MDIEKIRAYAGAAETFLQGFSEHHPWIWQIIVTCAILVVGILAVGTLRTIVRRRIDTWRERVPTAVEAFITAASETVFPLLYFGVFFLGIQRLPTPPSVFKVISVVGVAVFTFYLIRFLAATVEFLIQERWARKQQYISNESRLKALVPISKVVIWGIGVIFLLDNIGFEISSVLAGLGIGGVAIALASQNILGDLFNYFVIVFDRPFEIGDFIIIGDYLGEIEHIGIKSTRIRSLGGEQLIFSNTDLGGSRVRNYKRMLRRRVVFHIGVIYQTTADQLREIPEIVTRIIKEIDDTLFDRCHFFRFGDFSLDFETVYYVIGADYAKYMDIQQAINLRIKESFDERGIDFAYPTRTLYVMGAEGADSPRPVPEPGRETPIDRPKEGEGLLLAGDPLHGA